ncbi:hypothetical protein RB213_002592 [Colletotrichum asianum]
MIAGEWVGENDGCVQSTTASNVEQSHGQLSRLGLLDGCRHSPLSKGHRKYQRGPRPQSHDY